jgi:cytochrome P450
MFQIRKTKVDYTFRCNRMTIPAGTSLYMSLLHCYRDERRWPDPKRCDPSRFKVLSEGEKAQNIVHKLNPFSTGHTKCIGEKFAKMTWKTIVCAILQSFKIVRPIGIEEQKMKIVGGMTLQFDQPLYVQLQKRV